MYLSALTVSLSFLSIGALAEEAPFYSNTKYNSGGYGKYVTQTFRSNPQITSVPVVNFMRPFTNCDDGSYIFVAPRGNLPDATPMVLDITGSLIWAAEERYGEVYNVQVQHYKNEPFLTFWAGNDAVGGHGIGEYFMLDQHYNERYRIKAGNRMGGDLHGFTITPQNTALITIYDQRVVDISPVTGGVRRGWVWDAIFQELDIETGEVIFQWSAIDHIPIANSYTTPGDEAWDLYHINSVERDELGNYLVSFRFLRGIVYIDGKTGEVLWQLGGKANSFTDLSKGKASNFLGQHDAHWYHHEGRKYITFFDNRADWYNRMDDQSQGTRIEVDLENMTARLDQTFRNPFNKILSTSQGSYQTLPNGHVVLGYGYNGVVAEYSPDGTLLCEAYLQPASTFDSGDVQSYRNLRFNWTGFPNTSPNLVLEEKTLYMSWNGATEIATWLILGSDSYDEEYEQATAYHDDPKRSVEDAIVVVKTGFETEFQVFNDDSLRRFIRVIALDIDGRPLGTSNVVDIGDLATVSGTSHYDNDFVEGTYDQSHEGDYTHLRDDIEDLRLLIIFGSCAVLSGLMIVALALRWGRIGQMWSASPVSEKTTASEDKTPSKLRTLMQRVRNMVPGLRRRDSFAEFSAEEGLLDEDDLEEEHQHQHLPEVQFRGLLQGITKPDR